MRLFLILIYFFCCAFSFAREENAVILGGGVGGLSAALYLSRAGAEPIVIEGKSPGGLIAQSHKVQNWPGEKEISGWELSEKIKQQAIASGVKFISAEVIGVNFKEKPFQIKIKEFGGEEKIIKTKSCVIAMGTTPNLLNIPGEKEFWGSGVTNCAVCDGPLYKGKTVVVVGGGDSALLEAEYLSQIAKEVFVFVRKDHFKTVEVNRLNRLKAQPNVKIFFKSVVQEIQGTEDTVTHVLVKTANKQKKIPVDGVFLAIGSRPNSSFFKDQIALDEKGYIILLHDQETTIPGIYAVGDIVDPIYKQAISAAGDGAKAALQAKEHLSR